ncbi:MAG TPA: LysR family transcriptional regulator [Polyangiaceae bacterium]|nr:LysR family transcriptional regulator [Polyangiaceae bacterium]
MTALPELRLADLLTLLAVQRTGSISGAARELRVTPSQVSKAIARLERHFGVRLLSRGARGVAPTAAGRQVLPRIANAIEELRATNCVREDQAPALELTVAGPSYLVAHILPAIAAGLPRVRVRGLEVAPAYMRAYVAENVFDIALVPGGIENRPAAWTSEQVGSFRVVLLARPALAKQLEPLPLTTDRVRPLPFIGPTKTGGDRFVALNDNCPLSWEERWIAHEVQTIGAALEFASQTDHVVFGPALAAGRLLATGALVELPVVGWDVREPLHVLCNGDRVLSRVRTAVIRASHEILESA